MRKLECIIVINVLENIVKETEVKSNIIKEKVYCMKCIFQPPRDLLILTLNGIDDKN